MRWIIDTDWCFLKIQNVIYLLQRYLIVLETLILVIVQLWTIYIQIDYIEIINMDNYILEIPNTMGYTIRDIQRIMNFSDELKSIAEMTWSSDPEIKSLGNELLKTMKNA